MINKYGTFWNDTNEGKDTVHKNGSFIFLQLRTVGRKEDSGTLVVTPNLRSRLVLNVHSLYMTTFPLFVDIRILLPFLSLHHHAHLQMVSF